MTNKEEVNKEEVNVLSISVLRSPQPVSPRRQMMEACD
jgi:hypothetical protein